MDPVSCLTCLMVKSIPAYAIILPPIISCDIMCYDCRQEWTANVVWYNFFFFFLHIRWLTIWLWDYDTLSQQHRPKWHAHNCKASALWILSLFCYFLWGETVKDCHLPQRKNAILCWLFIWDFMKLLTQYFSLCLDAEVAHIFRHQTKLQTCWPKIQPICSWSVWILIWLFLSFWHFWH